MRSSSTFSILFWIYPKRIKNNQAPLYARITVNGKKLNISLKKRIDVRLWNPKRQRIKGTGEKTKNLNQYLDEVHSQLFQCYQELRTEYRLITPHLVKSKFLGEDRERRYTLKDIIEYHNSKMFQKLNGNTSRLYLTSQKYIMLFVKAEYGQEDMMLEDLNYKFILNFENFLRNHRSKHYKKKIGNNAVMKHIQRLRRMVTLAYHIEWINNDPFRKFKQKLEPTHRGFLTKAELERMENQHFTSKRLRTVRDLFVFSCYTGICYADLMSLTKGNLVIGIDGSYWIFTNRQKTKNAVKVPLLNKALEIIKYYRGDIKVLAYDELFPRISNQKMNAYLKEVAKLVQIEKKLTFHMARHTFATTITLTNGVPIETISKMLGHRKLSTTQIYAKVLERKVCDDMKVLREKLEEKIGITT